MMKNKLLQKFANLVLSVLGILLFTCSDTALDAAIKALKVCAVSIVPSLFPYMVLSGLIVRQRLLAPIEKILPMGKLFSLPREAASPFLLGALCGFPIGAKTAAELYGERILSKDDAERACAISNNTGPAFPVAVVGAGLWKSAAFGWFLYFAQILSAVIIGVLTRKKEGGKTEKENHSHPHEANPIRSFAESVTSSAAAILPLCGYIVFFSVVAAILRSLIPSAVMSAVLCAFLEFTSGVREAAVLGGSLGRFLTGFSLGFSGISVFVQGYSFTARHGISLRKTFLFKGVQGVLCGGMCTFFPIFFH